MKPITQTTPTGGKMPFESQEEYEAACKKVEGKPLTPYQPQTKKIRPLRLLIISQLIHTALTMMPKGLPGRKELATASMVFHGKN